MGGAVCRCGVGVMAGGGLGCVKAWARWKWVGPCV